MTKKKDRKLQPFFEMPEWWEGDWQGMPEFIQEDQGAYKSLIVNFETKEDMEEFMKLISQKFTFKTQSIWHPKAKIGRYMIKKYIDASKKDNK